MILWESSGTLDKLRRAGKPYEVWDGSGLYISGKA